MPNTLRIASFLTATWALTAAAQADCTAKAQAEWKASSDLTFTVEALTAGKACHTAVALLIVRNAKGTPLYTFVAPTENVAMLAEEHRTGGQKMSAALAEWIGLESNVRKPDFLIPWPKGASQPPAKEGEEFPFTASDEIGRERYEAARQQGHMLYCFVQGMESESCLAAEDADTVNQIGIQQFPG